MKIGLTGGMGSGKSSVASFLRAKKVGVYIDADQVCLELTQPGALGWQALKQSIAPFFFDRDNTIRRPLLRKAIFQDHELRALVDRLLHPLARAAIMQMIGGDEKPVASRLVFIEAPLLFEACWEKDFDKIIVVFADYDRCLERLRKRDGITVQEARMALAAQWPLADKVMRADHVVDNSGSWADTCLQLHHLTGLLLN